MIRYEYWFHDGGHGFIFADSYELEGNEFIFYTGEDADKRKVYEMPRWMVQDIKLAADAKAAKKANG